MFFGVKLRRLEPGGIEDVDLRFEAAEPDEDVDQLFQVFARGRGGDRRGSGERRPYNNDRRSYNGERRPYNNNNTEGGNR